MYLSVLAKFYPHFFYQLKRFLEKFSAENNSPVKFFPHKLLSSNPPFFLTFLFSSSSLSFFEVFCGGVYLHNIGVVLGESKWAGSTLWPRISSNREKSYFFFCKLSRIFKGCEPKKKKSSRFLFEMGHVMFAHFHLFDGA